MSIQSEKDFVALARIGRVVGLTLQGMAKAVRPGMTTLELDEIGARILGQHGARSAPRLFKSFPGDNCISVNDEAVHGIPGPRVIRAGDLVKIDVTGELDGYVADAALTMPIAPVSDRMRRITAAAEAAFKRAAPAARAGRPVYEIGKALEAEVRRHGFSVLRELHSHGVGRTIHEPPSIPQYYEPNARELLTEGLVITIEPIIAAGRTRVADAGDGWTIVTADGSLSAHYEHTIVVTKGQPVILTTAA